MRYATRLGTSEVLAETPVEQPSCAEVECAPSELPTGAVSACDPKRTLYEAGVDFAELTYG